MNTDFRLYYLVYFFPVKVENAVQLCELLEKTLTDEQIYIQETTSTNANLLTLSAAKSIKFIAEIAIPVIGPDVILVLVPRISDDESPYIYPKWLQNKLTIPPHIEAQELPQHVRDSLGSYARFYL